MIALPELPPPKTEVDKIRISVRLAASSTRKPKSVPVLQFKSVPPHELDLSQSFLDAHRMSTRSHGSTVAYSIVVHALILAVALLIPMWFADTLDIQTFTRTLLVAPLPPPPAPSAPPVIAARAASATSRHQITVRGQLPLPTYIPKHAAILNETPEAPEVGVGGMPDGLAGGVPGGVPGGVIGGIFSAGLNEAVPPPAPAPPAHSAPEAPRSPVRVGGQVREPRAISTPPPEYPRLAKQAQIQGVVAIDAIIDEHGNVVQMHAVSGPGLLITAALNAVSKWKYEPTILNGEPYPIALTVHVTFSMGLSGS